MQKPTEDDLRSQLKLYKQIMKNHIRDIKFIEKRIKWYQKELKKFD